MNTRQITTLNSYRTVAVTLEVHKAVWTPLGAFKRAVGSLDDCLESIDELARIQTNKTGAGAEKALCLVNLATAAHTTANAVACLASDTGDAALAAQVAFSRTDLTRGRDTQIITRCENILTVATEQLDALDDEYGVTQAKLNALQQKIDDFRKVQPKPRRTRAASSAATRQLSACFAQADQIVRNKLDKLVMQFKQGAPAFYNEYLAARKAVAQARRTVGDKAGKGSTPLSKAA